MFTDDYIHELQRAMKQNGGVTVTFHAPIGDNARCFIALNRVFGIEERGVLICVENCSGMFFNLDRPLNKFRLVSAGAPLYLADQLAALVNSIVSLAEQGSTGPDGLPDMTETTDDEHKAARTD